MVNKDFQIATVIVAAVSDTVVPSYISLFANPISEVRFLTDLLLLQTFNAFK